MLTTSVAGRVWDFSHAVGRHDQSGIAFGYPIGVTLGEGDLVYVLCRGSEAVSNVPWNRTGTGARVCIVSIGKVPGSEEFIKELGRYGDAPGQFIWSGGIATDSHGKLYVCDEWLNRVSIFDADGDFLDVWGSPGEDDGQLNGASGIAIDRSDNLYLVDSLNHRVQKFTFDGQYLAKWGGLGRGDGEFDSPWGITLDHDGFVYVADHNNHRVQKFTADGEFLSKFGSYGQGPDQLNHPSGVAVDPDGDVYVCDWANNRVQVFAPDGGFITSLVGDAQELSKWAKWTVDANTDLAKARRRVYTTEPEWRFALPVGVTFDARKERLIVCDSQRGRLQIYNKVKGYLEPQGNL